VRWRACGGNWCAYVCYSFLLETLQWVVSARGLVGAGPIRHTRVHQCTTLLRRGWKGKVKRANKSRITPFSVLTSPVPCCVWDEQKSEVQMEGRLRACLIEGWRREDGGTVRETSKRWGVGQQGDAQRNVRSPTHSQNSSRRPHSRLFLIYWAPRQRGEMAVAWQVPAMKGLLTYFLALSVASTAGFNPASV
jgi:hypothetical protein